VPGLYMRIKPTYKCKVKWDELEAISGSDVVRYCKECKHKVYDVTDMDSDSIHNLIVDNGEIPCMKFYYKTPDNKLKTMNCDRVITLGMVDIEFNEAEIKDMKEKAKAIELDKKDLLSYWENTINSDENGT
jgi:hypothetical protein